MSSRTKSGAMAIYFNQCLWNVQQDSVAMTIISSNVSGMNNRTKNVVTVIISTNVSGMNNRTKSVAMVIISTNVSGMNNRTKSVVTVIISPNVSGMNNRTKSVVTVIISSNVSGMNNRTKSVVTVIISPNVSGMNNRTKSVVTVIISPNVSGMNNRTKSVVTVIISPNVSGMNNRTKSVAMASLFQSVSLEWAAGQCCYDNHFNQCLWNEQQNKECCYGNHFNQCLWNEQQNKECCYGNLFQPMSLEWATGQGVLLWQSISTNVSGMSNRTRSAAMAIYFNQCLWNEQQDKECCYGNLFQPMSLEWATGQGVLLWQSISTNVSGMSNRTKSVAMAIYFNQCLWNEQQDKECCYGNLFQPMSLEWATGQRVLLWQSISTNVSGMSNRTRSVAMAIYFNQCLWNEQQDKECCYGNLFQPMSLEWATGQGVLLWQSLLWKMLLARHCMETWKYCIIVAEQWHKRNNDCGCLFNETERRRMEYLVHWQTQTSTSWFCTWVTPSLPLNLCLHLWHKSNIKTDFIYIYIYRERERERERESEREREKY